MFLLCQRCYCELFCKKCVLGCVLGIWDVLDGTTSAEKKRSSVESSSTLAKIDVLLKISFPVGYWGALDFNQG